MEKPLISFVLFAYNQEQYIREAVEGALSQTYSPLEIILSDDCSTDQTYAIMSDMAHAYNGPHKVYVRKNEVNRGIAGNYNAAVGMASGDIIVQAAGDDVSMPDRVMKTYQCFLSDPEIYCVSTDMDMVDDKGVSLQRCVVAQDIRATNLHNFICHKVCELVWFIHNASFSYRKTLYSQFGPIHERSGETYPIVFRSMLLGKKTHYLDDPLVKYRVTQTNTSVINVNSRDGSKERYLKRKAKLADLYAHNIRQMRADLQTALSAGLVCKELAHELDDNLLKIETSQTRKRDFYSNRNIANWINYILLCKHYSLKDKVRMYLEGGRFHHTYRCIKNRLIKSN